MATKIPRVTVEEIHINFSICMGSYTSGNRHKSELEAENGRIEVNIPEILNSFLSYSFKQSNTFRAFRGFQADN